jgi:asparagine synthase (glutamine-hydrolysing)
MAASLRHRGPDGFGLATGRGAGFVSTRLAIFDVPGGWQPMETGPGGSLIVYNGEVYNHPELRAQLASAGVPCRTTSDTEVVLRLLDRHGLDALKMLNGQFALAWWQPIARRLTLVRDRFGVRPLYYAQPSEGDIVFASEVKGLFASGEVPSGPDFAGMDDVFTLWGARAPRTPFQGVQQVRPGSVVVWERGRLVLDAHWWRPEYSVDQEPRSGDVGELMDIMRDSVRLRLRADVPVGTYLSGGVDSSLITALAQQTSAHPLRTFSVSFRDQTFDERPHQERVAAALGTVHHTLEIGHEAIADAFRDVIEHVESPMIRTAPVPMFLLARATREQGITVVATGEGADELFWGYDLFKEVILRQRARHDPSHLAEFDNLYPYLGSAGRRGTIWQRFFADAGDETDPLFSHQTRASATGALKHLYHPAMAAELDGYDSMDDLRSRLPESFSSWSALERAGYLELTTLLEPYLLSAQGDRVSMAHGVEGRYPFLDHRLFEFTAKLPPGRKIEGMRDKVILRELAAELLPAETAHRPKQPYRTPEILPFFGARPGDWVEDMLSPQQLKSSGIFDETPVAGLLRRCRSGQATGLREGMALVGVLSTQVWADRFFGGQNQYVEATDAPQVHIQMDVHQERR